MRRKVIFLSLLVLSIGSTEAVPVSRDAAAVAARAWVANGRRLGTRLGTEVEKVSALATSNNATFFAVKMKGGGTVFTSGDTELEPVICFTGSSDDFSTIDPRSPLWALLNRDLAVRAEILRRERAAEESSMPKLMLTSSATTATSAALPKTVAPPPARLANRTAAKNAWARLLAAEPKVVVKKASSSGGRLLKADAPASGPDNRVDEPDTVMVAPLLETKWSQTTHNDDVEFERDGTGFRCYNYDTETCYIDYVDGPWPHFDYDVYPPCGCTATATAQVMRYFKYPYASYETNTQYQCTIENWFAYYMEEWEGEPFNDYVVTDIDEQDYNGHIDGGVYDWANMAAVPKESVTFDNWETVGQAIGHLTRDVSIALNSTFAPDGTGALIEDIVPALKGAFGYANACTYVNDSVIDEARGEDGDGYIHSGAGLHALATRRKVIYANLDARRPVVLGIHGYPIGMVGNSGAWSGHAVVADGYGWNVEEGEGYTNQTDYVHINMGWSGQDDCWYNLPEIIAAETGATAGDSGYDFTVLRGAVYNIFTNETGEIVSGRVFNEDGTPAVGALVECGTKQTRTDANGIYALVVQSGAKGLVIDAEIDGGNAVGSATVSMGRSDQKKSVGNVWNVNIVLVPSPYVESVRNLRTGTAYAYFDYACAEAADDDSLQIEKPTRMKRTVLGIDKNLTISAADSEPTNTPVFLAEGTRLSVGAGVRLSLTNVAFCGCVTTNVGMRQIGGNAYATVTNVTVAALEPLTVTSGGSLSVAGRVTLPEIVTEDDAGFILAGELERSISLRPPSFARYAKIGTAECTAEAVTNSAKFVLNQTDDFLAITASPHPTLVWDLLVIPDADVVATLQQEGSEITARYATLDRLLQDMKPNATVVLRKNDTLTRPHVVTNGYLHLQGYPSGVTLQDLGPEAGFVIGDGGEMTVSGVVFRNYTGNGLFQVDGEGATLLLDSGTRISNVEGTGNWSGALAILKGEATVSNGSSIEGCFAHGIGQAVGKGGGASLKGAGCTLNLEGGRILNCRSQDASGGGGVFVGLGAKLVLSGAAQVSGSTSGGVDGGSQTNNICIAVNVTNEKRGYVELKDTLTGGYGSVGVSYDRDSKKSPYGNNLNDLLVDVTCSAADAESSLSAFFNDKTGKLGAALSTDGKTLYWQEVYDGARLTPSTDPQKPDVARIVRSAEQTNYFYKIEDAFAAVNAADLAVEVLANASFSRTVTVPNSMTIRRAAEAPAGTAVSRRAECGIVVPAGVTLTVSNLTVRGYSGDDGRANPCALFSANGGAIVLDEGAVLRDVEGDADRSAGAVEVTGGGSVTLKPGAMICNCVNLFANESDATGVGAGILVDSGAAYLYGGTVTNCLAYRGAGVYIGNKGAAYVKGPVAICGNRTLDGRRSDLAMSDLSAKCCLCDQLVGPVSVGVEDGVHSDTNVFGRVDAAYEGGLENLKVSAAKFFRDADPSVKGLVATNGTVALLVWKTAVKDGVYTDKNGEEYRAVGEGEPIQVPSPVPGLVYDGFAKTGVVEDVGFTLTDNVATNAGTYQAIATLKPGYIWDDSTETAKTIDWTIAPIGIAVPSAIGGLVYNGNEQTGVVAAVDALYTLVGNTATNAGDYKAKATITNANYGWEDGEANPHEIVWTIAKAKYEMPFEIVFTNSTYVYDGNTKNIKIEYKNEDGTEAHLPAGVQAKISYTGDDPNHAACGDYLAELTFTGTDTENYDDISTNITAWLKIIADSSTTGTSTPVPTPVPKSTGWTVETHHPTPIALKEIIPQTAGSMTLVITDRVEFCNYRLLSTDSLAKGFVNTGAWEQAKSSGEWRTNVNLSAGASFWKAEAADGTNMVPPKAEQ